MIEFFLNCIIVFGGILSIIGLACILIFVFAAVAVLVTDGPLVSSKEEEL